jgi:hypothetical protein
MKDMKDEITTRVAALEENKFSKADALTRRETTDAIHKDHELRLRRLEYWGAMSIGALIILQFIIPFILKYLFHL